LSLIIASSMSLVSPNLTLTIASSMSLWKNATINGCYKNFLHGQHFIAARVCCWQFYFRSKTKGTCNQHVRQDDFPQQMHAWWWQAKDISNMGISPMELPLLYMFVCMLLPSHIHNWSL
jgi:hypothetical protein